MTFIDLLNNPEAYSLIEQIEELAEETEQELVRIRNEYIKELKTKYGYDYTI